MNNIRTRRTIRRYTQQDVDNQLLTQLLDDAMRTQTMGNLQLYSVIVTRDADMKRLLAPLHFHQPMVEQAPVVLTFCADFHRTTQWCQQRQATPGYDNLLSLLNAVTDCLLYCQTFCNLAEDRGLGLCFLGTTIYNAHHIIELLQLPMLTLPVATITLGWPDEQPALTDRLPVNAILHSETYQQYTPQQIDTIYNIKESLAENLHFVAENKKDNLAQVFTDCRYTKRDNEAISTQLLHTLRQQGFMPK